MLPVGGRWLTLPVEWPDRTEAELTFWFTGVGQDFASVVDVPMETVRSVIDINLFGVWHGC